MIYHEAEMVRGQVMALHDRLEGAKLDEADRTALLRMIAELDRLAERIEKLAEAAA